MHKRILVITIIGLIALVTFGCSRKDLEETLASKVIVSHPGNEWNIFFQDSKGYGDAEYLMFLPLMRIDLEKGEPQPVLAERWEHSEDYREWTYFIRKDVRWHDGVPVTAHDIKFTMDLRQRVEQWPQSCSIEILNDHTIKYTYEEPTDGRDTWFVYYPKHLLEDLDPEGIWDWDFWKQPVGNGPYRYVRHIPNMMVELDANPDYYRGKPKIESVILKFHDVPPLTELLSGDVDILNRAANNMLLTLKNDNRFKSYYRIGHWISALYWNHRNPLFQSPEIRRALTMAINRYELSKVLNNPEGVPVLETITTMRQFWKGQYPDPLPYDPDGARKILEKHGWKDSNGDGIRERDGKEFRFMVLNPSKNSNYSTTAIYVQDQFRKIGVKMEIQTLNPQVTRARRQSGKFEAICSGFKNSVSDGHLALLGRDSYIGYNNPEMIRLLDLAKITIDPDKKDAIYRKIMPIFMQDMPITLLIPSVAHSVAHRRIKGLIDIIRANPTRNMEHLWIEEEK